MDERGYVLSGVGMLLLIPLMIMIPIALSLQEESSQIPSTFVKSDVVFRTSDSIRNDIQEKIIKFTDEIYNKTYRYDNPQLFAGEITKLYNNTREEIYKNAYSGVVDSVEVKANNNYETISMNNETGTIPLKNGIKITYNLTNIRKDNETNIIYYYYRITATVNVIINVAKLDARHNQIYEYSFDSQLIINTTATDNTTAQNNVRSFFNNLGSLVGSYCVGGG